MMRTAALFMIFLPCRPIGMLRIDPTEERWSDDKTTVELPVMEKMNRGRDKTVMIVRSCEIPQLCPLTHYRLMKVRAEKMGFRTCIWIAESGKPFAQSAAICRLLSKLLREINIPQKYTAYSIRHALITALFDMGMSEVDVNSFTGHYNNSHTAISNYFHLDSKWVGRVLIGPPPEVEIP
jgi:site-specific recombinase XerD